MVKLSRKNINATSTSEMQLLVTSKSCINNETFLWYSQKSKNKSFSLLKKLKKLAKNTKKLLWQNFLIFLTFRFRFFCFDFDSS